MAALFKWYEYKEINNLKHSLVIKWSKVFYISNVQTTNHRRQYLTSKYQQYESISKVSI